MNQTDHLEDSAELGRFPTAALIALSAITVLTVVGLAIFHINDRFSLEATEGLRIALAKYFNLGELFPPLREDGFYGGSRYMPIPIVMHAALSLVLNDYIVSGKILGLAYGLLTIAAIVLILRRRGTPLPLALLLASILPATDVGMKSITGFGAELFPVLFQIIALAVVEENPSRRNVVIGSVLAVIAFFSKVTALWGLGAIAIWLLVNNRRRFGIFVVATLVASIFGFVVVYVASSGQVIDSFAGIMLAGPKFPPHVSIQRIVIGVREFTPALLILVVPLLAGLAISRRAFKSIFLIALCIHAVILAVMFLDPATAENHLIDLVVLMILATATAWSWSERSTVAGWQMRLVAVAGAWALVLGFWFGLRAPLGEAIAIERGRVDRARFSKVLLREEVSPFDSILSSNPYIPVSRGQQPVVLEPVLFLRMAERHPEWADELAGRVRNQEFTKIVLTRELSEVIWYERLEFGLEVHSAIVENYEFEGSDEGYFVYMPKEAEAE